MKSRITYKQGYKILICDQFYEVSYGNRALYYGKFKHRPSVEEVWNKTIGLGRESDEETGRRKKNH